MGKEDRLPRLPVAAPALASAAVGAALAVAVVLSAAVMALQPEQSADVWHHVKSGWLVAERQGPARVDVFSCTAQGKPWIQYEWLAQLGLYEVYRAAGVAGLILIRVAAMATTAFLLLIACRARRGVDAVAAVVAVMLAVTTLSGRCFTRPEIFTWVIFAAWLLSVEKIRQGSRRCFLAPALLMVPWVNMHGAWPAGLAWLGLICAGETAALALRRPAALPAHTLRLLWGALGLALVATLVNPYGPRIWEVPLTLTRTPEVRAFIAEWQRPDLSHWLDPLHVGAWVLLIALVAAPQGVSLPDAAVVAVFGVLSLTARRHIALAMLVMAPILAGQLGLLWAQLRRQGAPPARPILKVAGALLACAALVVVALGGFALPRAGVGLAERKYPVGAAKYISENHLEGNLFNSYAFGNYLLFALYPGNHVFIDGRVDMYGAEPLRLYDQVRQASPGWRRTLADRSIEICVLETTRTPDARLLDVLHASADWALVYWDDNSAVYVARAADRAEFLSRACVYAVRPDRFEPDLLETPSGLARAERDYDRKVKEDPDCVLALQGKAQCLQERGDTAAAVPLLRKAVALRPENAGLAYNLGAVLLTMNDLDEAATWFRRTLALHEYEAEAYMALGMIGQHKGDAAQALECYAEVLTRAAENWKVYWNLSVLFEEGGDLDNALGAARDVVRLQPKNRAALERLRALTQKKQARGTP